MAEQPGSRNLHYTAEREKSVTLKDSFQLEMDEDDDGDDDNMANGY